MRVSTILHCILSISYLIGYGVGCSSKPVNPEIREVQIDSSRYFILDDQLESGDFVIRTDELDAMLRSVGCQTPNDIYKLYEASHDLSAPTPRDAVFLTELAIRVAGNSGLIEWYRGYGEMWAATVKSYRMIGNEHAANIIELSGKLFGPTGPPLIWEERNSILNAMPDNVMDELEELDDDLMARQLWCYALTVRYMLDHRRDFKEHL